jgi:hypothetical protein
MEEGVPVYRYGGQYWPAKHKQGRAWTKPSKIFQLKLSTLKKYLL